MMALCDRFKADMKIGRTMKLEYLMVLDQDLQRSLDEFHDTLSEEQTEAWEKIMITFDVVRAEARKAQLNNRNRLEISNKINAFCGLAPHPVNKAHTKTTQNKRPMKGLEEVMVDMGREMHSHSGKLSDILKSLLMWKESPDERIAK